VLGRRKGASRGMWIPIVRWSWMVGKEEEGGMFGQRSWCTLDETLFCKLEWKDVDNGFLKEMG